MNCDDCVEKGCYLYLLKFFDVVWLINIVKG